jgi:hypothetical protein
MSYSKRQFVEQAFSAVGLAAYIVNLSPEQLDNAVQKLDGMMAMWNGKGIRLGWPLVSDPTFSNLDDVTGVPDAACEAIYMNLAIRVAPGFGKTVAPDVKVMASEGYNMLLAKATMPHEVQTTRLPIGAGNKPQRRLQVFFEKTPDPITSGQDGTIDLS